MDTSLPLTESSLWLSRPHKQYPQLRQDIETDVVILGGGIAGLSVAYKLQKAGFRVVVIEKNTLASGTTGSTTGKVSLQHGLIYASLIKKFGKQKAVTYANAYKRAFKEIETLVKNEKIACEWSYEDHFLYTNQSENLQAFRQEAAAASSLGLPVNLGGSLYSLPFATKESIVFEKQAKFNAAAYVAGLARRVVAQQNCFIFEHSPLQHLRKGSPNKVITPHGSITAKHVVIATKIPPGPLLARVSYGIIAYPENSYIVAGKTNFKLKGMYNTPDKEHYSLLPFEHDGTPYMLVGGENHIPGLGIANRHYHKLAAYNKHWFAAKDIAWKWRAMDYIAYDKLPVVGKLYPYTHNIFAITGFKKWGLTSSMVAANVILDHVTEQKTPETQLFTPHRISAPLSIPSAFIDYLKK